MSTIIDTIERAQLRRVPRFQAGDRLRVHFLVIEGTRRRTQVFEGVAIKRQGSGVARDLHRPQAVLRRRRRAHVPAALAEDRAIEVAARGDVRRAKLYYLRDRVGKARPRPRARLRRPRGDRRARACCSPPEVAAEPRRPVDGARTRRSRPRARVEAEASRRVEAAVEAEARRRGRGAASRRGWQARGGRRAPRARRPSRRPPAVERRGEPADGGGAAAGRRAPSADVGGR